MNAKNDPESDWEGDPPQVPLQDQICKCDHGRHRHRITRQGEICIEQFCPCSNFTLYRVR